MMRYEGGASEDLAIVKLLLDNCIKLLKDDRNSQVSIEMRGASYKTCTKVIVHGVFFFKNVVPKVNIFC